MTICTWIKESSRILYERLKSYADDKGQTVTTALERILKQYFDNLDKTEKSD